ncbi:hypothetical protein [Listeria costaricensis]|uniref:hypothetical protein n=1 Tax=Listeria costaricensis TaxID=2026604 RepID=UPI000C08D632|nr:hypothetical protein [Listeria costaricensis]
MTAVIIILLAAAIILFVLSFTQKGENKHFEEELEEVASQLMHENYELKKRVTVLEKAMNIDKTVLKEDDDTSSAPSPTPKMKELLKKQVITLYTTGIATEEIIEQSSLSKEEVEKIIEEYLEH